LAVIGSYIGSRRHWIESRSQDALCESGATLIRIALPDSRDAEAFHARDIPYNSHVVGQNPELAAWLISRRAQIERGMCDRLGPAAPHAGAAESEVLRRFRMFAASALQRGVPPQPSLDGLRINERRAFALLTTWVDAAEGVAGPRAETIRSALSPLLNDFRNALRTTGTGRRRSGAPRTKRRAVMAAIDRVADSFFAVDADSGEILDANPAAGALLGVNRDALLGVNAMSFVPDADRDDWWTEIDAMTEGAEARRFAASLKDKSGEEISVECSITRFAARGRTLALILARPAVPI